MRISDWSSDVFSSYLGFGIGFHFGRGNEADVGIVNERALAIADGSDAVADAAPMRRRAEMQLRLAELRREDDTAVGADAIVAAVQRLEIVGEHPALQQQRVLRIFHRHADAPGEAERSEEHT